MKRLFRLMLILVMMAAITGCSINIYGRRPSDVEEVGRLSDEVTRLEALRQEDLKEMQELKALLERKLKSEIRTRDVKVELAERGLVITFIDKILFDSGKADIKEEGFRVLGKVIDIVKKNAGDRNIGIEGHTDNVPITYSGWKSNWELSTARATSVLHYLVDKGGIDPTQLLATGYGEHKPVASNNTEEGRRRNRRVEIILLPREFEQTRYQREKSVEIK